MSVFMKDCFGNGFSFPLDLNYCIHYLFFWSIGYNYIEIWK